MATLIQSKQIEGVVTASVIQGEFSVQSGSVNLSGATGVTGSFTGSFIGDGSGLTNIPYSSITGTPIFKGGSNTTIASSSNIITISSTGGGGSTDISHLNTFTASYYTDSASFDARITGISASGSGADWNTNLQNIPSGLVSGSVLRTLDGTGVLSGSIVDQLPSGIISGSTFTSFSSSVDSRLDTLENATDNTGSDTQTLSISGDQLTISSGNTVTIPTGSGTVPAGTISGSAQITALGFTSGSHTTLPSGTISSSAQVISSLPSGTISGSTQITDGSGIFSGSLVAGTNITINQSGNDFIISSSASGDTIPAGTISSSAQIIDSLPSGVVSGSSQLTSSYDSRYLQTTTYTTDSASFDTRISNIGDHANITPLNLFTQSADLRLDSIESFTSSIDTTIKTKLNTDDVLSGSIESLLPSGVVSGSAQITSVITDTYISASAASSGFGSGGSSDFTTLTNVPIGLVSGSSQLTSSYDSRYLNVNGDGVVSGSVLRTLDGTGVVSGSVLRTLDGTGVVSGSVLRTLDGTNVVSSSTQTISHLGGTNIFSGSVIGEGNITITSGSGNITISGSGGSSDVTFNGNRIISQEKLPAFFTSSFNPGTSGSVQDFLNAIFYPNNPPSITTGNQTISEYSASNAQIVQLVATDPEGQSLTFGTASSYTDDLVRVSSAGVMTLNALAESSSFNTDSVGGGHGHLVTVTATDTFNSTIEKDIYIIVTPNEAPVFRETSVSGNIITSVTVNLNENSANDTLVKRVFFTDTENDTITITTSSIDGNHFDVTVYGTYLDIRQNTGSLDYEQQTTYTFSITASDEHYENSQDSDSRTFLPVTVNVTDNLVPVVNSQVVGTINENSSNGASVGTISATDNEGDSISFVTFNLHKLLLDGSTVASSSYGGTSQLTDPHENPFQMDSSGNVTRKTGVYLNSDLINQYQYRVQVKDNYNATISSASVVSINVSDDTPATLSDNWTAGPYIKESEVSGTTIKRTNYGSDTADYDSNQSGTWSSSNPAISINSNGNLSLGVDLSGSVTQSGDTLDSTITFTNTFGTTTTDNLSVSVVQNSSPFANFVTQSSNFNTNLATNGTNLESVSISDDESDTPYSLTIGGTNASSFNAVPQNAASSSWQIQANGNLSAGTYNYEVTVRDSYSKQTTYTDRSITIAQATTGSLSVSNAYVIESATNGDQIKRTTNGRTGNQSYVSVAYSPDYGSQSATSFASSNNLISINSSTGYLSVGNDISGSGNVAGDTITTTITWTDQYGNNGSDEITVNVAENFAPTVSSTSTSNLNTNQATGSAQVLNLALTDTESDAIPNGGLSFSGYNSTYFTPSISTPNMRLLVNNTSVPAGTYAYTASIQDEHGFSTRTVSNTFTIVQASTGSLGGDTAIYIIESAESGSVFRDQTGFNQGSPAQLTVSYGSPNYGSAVVQSFTSSMSSISVDNSGNLTLNVDLSGSVTQSGDTFTSTITFRDQYDNIGSGVVTATVFGNSSPSANFTDNGFNSDQAISGSDIGTLTVTDTESNSPFSVTLAGTDGGKFDIQGSSSPFTIQPTGSLSAGTYTINITVTDSYSESVTLTGETIVVSQAADYGKVYIYTSTRTGGGTLSNANYDGIMGITSENTTFEPDLVTGYQSTGPSPLYAFKTGYLGSGSVTVGGGTMTLRNTVSGSNLDTIISSSFNGSGGSEQIMIIFPSGSDMDGIPTSMTDTLGGSTSGEYVLYLKAAGESSYTAAGTQIHMFDVDSAVEGYTRWNIIGRNSANAAGSYEVRLIPSSGSAP